MRRVWALVSHPVASAYAVTGKAAPGLLWRRLAARGRNLGLPGPRFLLSLDCDTDLDIAVVSDVHRRLGEAGIKPVYAVPGELLERGVDVYRAIADDGAEFINHGYVQHTQVDAERTEYVSNFFYDRLPRDVAFGDVVQGHEAVERVLGLTPTGFRTPHFGTFQGRKQLGALHGVLRSLGYRYSSSTVPMHSYRHGPVDRRHGLPEIPVSGCPDWPLGTLDTWGFRFAPHRVVDQQDFVRQCDRLLAMCRAGAPLFVNIYGDPSQIYDWPEFFEAVERFAPFAVGSFDSILDEVVAA